MARFCAYPVSNLSDISESRKQGKSAFGFYHRLFRKHSGYPTSEHFGRTEGSPRSEGTAPTERFEWKP